MLPREAEGTIMPIHDWTCVGAGIFHHFHQRWIGAVTDVLNQHLLPAEYYALAEQQGVGFEPDVTAETDSPKEQTPRVLSLKAERCGRSACVRRPSDCNCRDRFEGQ